MARAKSSLNYLRITQAGKTPGVFLTAQILLPDQKTAEESKIFAILEIAHPISVTPQIGQTVLNTLKSAYARAASTSDLENFEQALKETNEVLNKIVQSGETSWIGNLHAVFALIVNQEIHLAVTGKASAWLIRNQQINDIIDQRTASAPPHPLKTFSTITSGSIMKQDRFILASSQLQNYFSLKELKNIFQSEQLDEAGKIFVKKLKNKQALQTNLFLLDAPAENQPKQENLTIYLDHPLDSPLNQAIKFSKKYLLPFVSQASRRALHTSTQYFKSGLRLTKTQVLPKSRQIIKQGAARMKAASRQINQKYLAKHRPSKTQSTPLPSPSNLNTDASIIGRSIYTINDYRASHSGGLKQKCQHIVSQVKQILYRLDNQIYLARNWLIKKRTRPLSLLIALLALIILLIVSISVQRRKQAEKLTRQQHQQLLQQAQEKLDQAKSALILSNQSAAVTLFEEAITSAEALLETELAESAKSIIQQAEKKSDHLTQTTRLSATKPFADHLASQDLFTYQGNAYFLDQKNPSIIQINILSGKRQTLTAPEMENDAWVKAAPAADGQVYLLSQQGKIYHFNAQNQTFNRLNLSNQAKAKAVDLDQFAGNLYLLAPNEGQIWKYRPAQEQNHYQAPVGYAQKSLAKNIRSARAIAIDGAVYLLSQGKIIKISRGTQRKFSFHNLPKALADFSEAVDIFTDEHTPSLYLLDKPKPRIVEFDKNGNYLHEYILPPNIKQPRAFQVDHIGRKAWILADQQAYELDL